jgi:hypothetical protein
MCKKLTKRSANYRALRVTTKSERIADATLPPNKALNPSPTHRRFAAARPRVSLGVESVGKG